MKTVLAALLMSALMMVCHAETRTIVVEVSMITNTPMNRARTMDDLVVSIHSGLETDRRENLSISDASKHIKEGLKFYHSLICVVMVIHTETMMVKPLIKAINENPLLDLIDLQSPRRRQADALLEKYGIKL